MAIKKRKLSLVRVRSLPWPAKQVVTLTQEATNTLLLSWLWVEEDAGTLSTEHPASRNLARADS